MSAGATDRPGAGAEPPPAGAAGDAAPSEEELRAAYEAELSRITATDMIAQATVSLLNIGARRLGAPPQAEGAPAPSGDPGRDLEQVRDAIDGARALLEILGRRIPQELGPLRDALSRLQMAYAQEARPAETGPQAPSPGAAAGEPGAAGGGEQPPPGAGQQQPPEPEQGGPGPAEASGRLWVPGR